MKRDKKFWQFRARQEAQSEQSKMMVMIRMEEEVNAHKRKKKWHKHMAHSDILCVKTFLTHLLFMFEFHKVKVRVKSEQASD
mgnify:CR=1 FL=1